MVLISIITHCKCQRTLRRPIFILLEFYESGNYSKKIFKRSKHLIVPNQFAEIFSKMKHDWLFSQNISENSKKRNIWGLSLFFIFLGDQRVSSLNQLKMKEVMDFVECLSHKYSAETIRHLTSILRDALTWLYKMKLISFSGRAVFPSIRKGSRSELISAFNTEEIAAMLNRVDRSARNGLAKFYVLSLIAYLGLRSNDVINLKFENVDWENDRLHFIQHKTDKELVLPLIDEVKFPMLDYILNGRNESRDSDYILCTMNAPYTKYTAASGIYSIISEALTTANIDTTHKTHGPHSLRHSLGTNMINAGASIQEISQVLGHSNSKTSEIYITKDETHLRELSLEVPYGLQ